MLTRLERFAERLRAAGIAVSVHETIGAARALGAVPAADRDVLRAGLAAVVLKDFSHRPAFDAIFDVTFAPAWDGGDGEEEQASDPAAAAAALRAALEDAARRRDVDSVRAIASEVARTLAGVGERQSGPGYFVHRAGRAVGADEIWRRLLDGIAEGSLEGALARADVDAAREAFENALRAEVLRLLVREPGEDTVNRWISRALPEDVELVTATRDEMDALRRAIPPLARRLATRLAKRKRAGRHGRLDVRRTVRSSLSTGGVPFQPRFRRRHPHRPELFLLCDVSGSVAAFSRFTMQLVHALQNQFRAVRSFVFVDTLDEVTEDFRGGELAPSLASIIGRARVVWGDGHSDYGASLRRFEETAGAAVTHRSVVIVLGDARTNYRDPRADVLERLSERAHRVFWLNPEPRRWWDTGDSVASVYADHADRMFECRSLRQLEAFIERVV